MRLTLALAVLVIAVDPAKAYFLDGNGLHSLCQSDRNVVTAYTLGAVDAFTTTFSGEKKRICLPLTVTVPQITDVFCKYLQGNPENRNLPGNALVYQMLLNIYPCPS